MKLNDPIVIAVLAGFVTLLGYFVTNALERRRAIRVREKQRLHQASFREAVMYAYGGRCAVSGLPESRLLG